MGLLTSPGIDDAQRRDIMQLCQPRHTLVGRRMGVADQRQPLAAPCQRPARVDDPARVVTEHALAQRISGVEEIIHAIESVTGRAIERTHLDAFATCGLHHGREGVLTGRIGSMSQVLITQVILQARG